MTWIETIRVDRSMASLADVRPVVADTPHDRVDNILQLRRSLPARS